VNTIYKYLITPGYTALMLPLGAKVLTVQVQNGDPFIWVLQDPNEQQARRMFTYFGTGHEVPSEYAGGYIGTFMQEGTLVWHLFERKF
jgi:hypothetical protein